MHEVNGRHGKFGRHWHRRSFHMCRFLEKLLEREMRGGYGWFAGRQCHWWRIAQIRKQSRTEK